MDLAGAESRQPDNATRRGVAVLTFINLVIIAVASFGAVHSWNHGVLRLCVQNR